MIKRAYLAPDVILSILLKKSKNYNVSIAMLNSKKVKFVLSDFALIEALFSVKKEDELDFNNFAKLIKISELVSSNIKFPKFTEERKQHLREVAKIEQMS